MSAPHQNDQAQKLPNATAAMSVQQQLYLAQQHAIQQALANGQAVNPQQYAMLMQGQLPVAAAGAVNQRPASQQGTAGAVAPAQKVTIEQKEWGEFFNEFPQLRAAFNQQPGNGNEQQKQQIIAKFTAWKVARQKRQAEQLNKLRHQPSTSSAASVPQSKTVAPVPAVAQPQSQPAAPVNSATLARTAASAADMLREKAAREQAEALKKLENRFPFISRPITGDDRSFLPRQRLKVLSKKACADLGVGKLTADAEQGIKSLAADFAKGAISFAVGAARRKRSQKLDPADVALYLKQTYDIDIPSLKGAEVTPYKRLAASDVHKARLAAVRRGNVALTREKAAAERSNKPSGGRKGASVPGAKRTPAAAAVGEEEEIDVEERPPAGKKARSKAAKANGKPAAAAAVEEEDMPDIM